MIFSEGSPVTDALGSLYLLWGRTTSVLFDAMVVAYTLNPQLCLVQPMHIVVDDLGVTRGIGGAANAQVCLHPDSGIGLLRQDRGGRFKSAPPVVRN